MARPNKIGLDYFPFDIDFFQDLKVRKLIKYQGGKAVTVYALLLCNIYKVGYYMRWDEELPFIVSEFTGFEEAYIREVIKCCMVVGLFSKELYESDRILTSKGIQQRYQKVCDSSRRNSYILEFSLVSSEETGVSSEETHISSEEMGVSSAKTAINSAKSTQSKVNKKKRKSILSENTKKIVELSNQNLICGSKDNAKYLEVFFAPNQTESLLLLCKQFGLGTGGLPKLRELADEVVTQWNLSEEKHYGYSGWSNHLINTMRKKNNDKNDQNNNQNHGTLRERLSNRRGKIEVAATSSEDYETSF